MLQIAEAPRVLAALNPAHAVGIFVAAPTAGFVVLGAVALAITGGEALYADMGHFGRFPVRLAWFALVLPALVLTSRPVEREGKTAVDRGSQKQDVSENAKFPGKIQGISGIM